MIPEMHTQKQQLPRQLPRLGFPYITPTIIRKINGKLGLVQIYINSPVDLFKKGEYEKVLTKISAEDEPDLRIFFLFGQWDSGAHHLLHITNEQHRHFIVSDNSAIRNHHHIQMTELPSFRVLYSEKFNGND